MVVVVEGRGAAGRALSRVGRLGGPRCGVLIGRRPCTQAPAYRSLRSDTNRTMVAAEMCGVAVAADLVRMDGTSWRGHVDVWDTSSSAAAGNMQIGHENNQFSTGHRRSSHARLRQKTNSPTGRTAARHVAGD
jgi:hypothetical protein